MSINPLNNEKELFQRIANSDETAFEQIFHAYNERLLPFVGAITKSTSAAEEIVQEVFLRLWLHRASLANMEEPAAWLTRVASNLSLSYLKRVATYSRILQTIKPEETLTETDPATTLDTKKIAELVADAVAQLPAKRQQIYRLSREKGFTRQEIADSLQLSESTVKNQLTAALKFIQEYITTNTGVYIPVSLLIFLR